MSASKTPNGRRVLASLRNLKATVDGLIDCQESGGDVESAFWLFVDHEPINHAERQLGYILGKIDDEAGE